MAGEDTRARRWLGALPFAVAAVVGVGLVAVVLVASQLPASKAADELVIVASPTVNDEGLERLRADLEEVTAVSDSIDEQGLSRLARIAGTTRPQLLADLETRAPEFSKGMAEAPKSRALAEKVIGNLERREDQFESAASLPGLGLTLRDGVWAELALGILLVVVGVAGIARPRRLLAAVVLVVGFLLVAVPLALDHPSKTSDTDALLDSLRPFSADKVKARADALAVAQDQLEGFGDEVVPYVARQGHTTPQAVTAQLAAASPRLSPASLTETAVILDRFGGLVDFSERIQPLLVKSDKLSARTTMWLTIGPGIVLVLTGAVALAGTWRSRRFESG